MKAISHVLIGAGHLINHVSLMAALDLIGVESRVVDGDLELTNTLHESNTYIKELPDRDMDSREASLLKKSRDVYNTRNAHADAALAQVPPSLESLVVTGYNDICKVPLDFTGYVENETAGVVKVFHDLGSKGYLQPNVRAYFLNGKFIRTQLTPALPYTLSDLSPQPDSLAAHHALAEQTLLTESEVAPRIPAPTEPYAAPTPPDPTPLVPFESVTWGDPQPGTNIEFLDTYWRVMVNHLKHAKDRDITISRALLCDGEQSHIDTQLLQEEVSANYHPFQYSGEILVDWGYDPTTDEVTLRFSKE